MHRTLRSALSSSPRRALASLALAFATAATASADVVTFSDGTFGAPWFSTKVTSIPSLASGSTKAPKGLPLGS